MPGYKVYLVGFSNNDLSADEQTKLDEHISTHGSGWSSDPYKPIDQRNPDFQNVADTFADEDDRPDGKHIVIFQEQDIDQSEKDKFFEAFKEIKALFSDVVFEAHDDGGRIG